VRIIEEGCLLVWRLPTETIKSLADCFLVYPQPLAYRPIAAAFNLQPQNGPVS
jgi:hypothetical protein